MTTTERRIDFAGAVSQLNGAITVQGLKAPVVIRRDGWGIAHIRAQNERDAFFGQGFAAAQDRLWQMEYDRLRASGRWAEAAGKTAVSADKLARRLQLVRAAKADVEAMSTETRAMFSAYAAGVNAFLQSGQPLPVEYALTGLKPEPWQVWHSVAAFKVRHVLMGVWQQKLAQARLLAMIGAEAYGKLDGRPPIGSPVIVPPSGKVARLFEQAADDIASAAEQLGFLAEVEAGSNSWAVHGSRTSTGMPVLCNDSHRALDVPSVYWQVHVACPEFDAIGATFPGLPGFPHFGHNGSVAWNITHTSADYQDLYVEQFDPGDPTRYRTPDGWATAERQEETIAVRGGEPVTIETWRTRHGPIVHGDPKRGLAISMRYTATDTPTRAFEALRPMLTAKTVGELFEAQREWVDPVNNLVAADTSGNIGYLTRGYLPVRSSQAHREFPAAGWTGENEWTGRVPFEQLPQTINPEERVIVTANQRVIAEDEPYIADKFAVPARAQRIREHLIREGTCCHSYRYLPEEIAALQGDIASLPAQDWMAILDSSRSFAGDAERARAMLRTIDWDGYLMGRRPEPLLYAYFRREVARELFEPIVGKQAWAWLTSEEMPALGRMISQWLTDYYIFKVDRPYGGADMASPDGRTWNEVLPGALARAWAATVAKAGPDPAAWRWGDHHSTNAKHTLADTFPELAPALNPKRISVGGDGDTVQCAGYGWGRGKEFDITSLSVYRQVVDLSEIDKMTYVIPGGVSGLPGTEHYGDQFEYWRIHQRIPAHYTEIDVETAAVRELTLTPAAAP